MATSSYQSNYQVPGVYVTQSNTGLTSLGQTSLNLAIVADQIVTATMTDNFYVPSPANNIPIGVLSMPMVLTASGNTTVTWASGSTTVTGVQGTDYALSVDNYGACSISTSGLTSSNLPSGTVSVTYQHQFGAYGTYTNQNSVISAIGIPVSGTTIINPASLAAQIAFQNGANTVTILPVTQTALSGAAGTTGNATAYDWYTAFTIVSGSRNKSFISNLHGIDVITPLYGFTASGQLLSGGSGSVSSGIVSYVNSQASNGTYQRVFVGVDGTSANVTATGMQALASSFNSTRISLAFPGALTYNPGANAYNNYTSTNFQIAGTYLAPALAALFVSQTPDVSTPITNKIVNGFYDIPNQISQIDARTSYLPYGVLVTRKKRDGNIWVLHGITTNVTNWVNAEISINAIGDRLSRLIGTDLNNSYLVGGPLNKNTIATTLGVVQGTLTNALSNGLIQGYQNLSVTNNQATPTTLNVTFQYAPTYPLNYIQAVFSLNTNTGQIVYINAQSNIATY